MYEINTHNLKIYLVVLSVIFILTNGVPILNMFNDMDDNYSYKKSIYFKFHLFLFLLKFDYLGLTNFISG